jgi:hypothetical protein
VNWGDPLSPDNEQTFVLGMVLLTKADNGIDWDPATRLFSVDHVYLDDNPSGTPSDDYTITVTVTDDDTGVGTDTTTVTVTNVAPVIVIGPLEYGDPRPSVVATTNTTVPPLGGYDFVKEGLQLLSQYHVSAWGDSWCGPTAAGTSLGWFAEYAGFPQLIPDTNGNGQVDEAEKYEVIGILGGLMGTDPDDGTTDKGFVDGLREYLESVGLGGSFTVKVFDADLGTTDPTFDDYAKELEDGEDVLVGIEYPGGGGHWLTGRSFKRNAMEPHDVSFVDPATGSVYHTQMKDDGSILYNDEWVTFDIMVSVSPIEEGSELALNSYFVTDVGLLDTVTATVNWGDGSDDLPLVATLLQPGLWRLEGPNSRAYLRR